MENNKPKTLDELKKAVGNPALTVAPTMILHYGRITLHVESEGFAFDGLNFHQQLKVIKEIKPVRQPRKPKEEVKGAAAKAKSK